MGARPVRGGAKLAASLLAATALPITEVMLASGFGSLAHFERSFKTAFAVTPTAYREAHGQSGRG